MRRKGARRTGDAAQAPRYNALAMKALFTLELDGQATIVTIKAKYKELVKRNHPDANGGDRSSEEKLREIIQAIISCGRTNWFDREAARSDDALKSSTGLSPERECLYKAFPVASRRDLEEL